MIDTYEYWSTNDNGTDDISYSLLYTFRAPDGREFKEWSRASWGEVPEEYKNLPVATEVEYLPSDPSISRIHGEGAQSIPGWVLKDILLNLILVLCTCAPGALLCANAVFEWKRIREFNEKYGKEGSIK